MPTLLSLTHTTLSPSQASFYTTRNKIKSQKKNLREMNSITCLLFFFSSLAFMSIASAQERAPHGLANEGPMAFSPSAFDFFHAKPENQETKVNPCPESGCSPLPMAAKVKGAAAEAQESKIASMPKGSRSRIGAGGVTGIVFGVVFAVFSVIGAYYVLRKRHVNVNHTDSVQSDV